MPVSSLYFNLDSVTREALQSEIKARTKSTSIPVKTFLIEFCCDHDSELGKQAEHMQHVEVLRVTESMDALKQSTIDMLLDFVRKHPGCHIHASIPCTAWTNVQNLNIAQHGEPFKAYLKRIKHISLTMFGRFLTVAREVRKYGGKISYEWPPTVSGWKEPLVVRGLTELGLDGIEIHGCDFDLKSKVDPNED